MNFFSARTLVSLFLLSSLISLFSNEALTPGLIPLEPETESKSKSKSKSKREDKDVLIAPASSFLNEKFTQYRTTYFVFGANDLKLQFSFKYRLTSVVPLYFTFTQLMFWNIYDQSKPFREINYNPEIFYRILNTPENIVKAVDAGVAHLSNGKDQEASRSFNKFFLRASVNEKINRHNLSTTLTLHKIVSEEQNNKNIDDHLGYWQLDFILSDLIHLREQIVDFELRAFSGKQVYDLDQGAYLLGLLYHFSSNANTTLYLQRYSGYAENLLDYQKRYTEHRFGVMLVY